MGKDAVLIYVAELAYLFDTPALILSQINLFSFCFRFSVTFNRLSFTSPLGFSLHRPQSPFITKMFLIHCICFPSQETIYIKPSSTVLSSP